MAALEQLGELGALSGVSPVSPTSLAFSPFKNRLTLSLSPVSPVQTPLPQAATVQFATASSGIETFATARGSSASASSPQPASESSLSTLSPSPSETFSAVSSSTPDKAAARPAQQPSSPSASSPSLLGPLQLSAVAPSTTSLAVGTVFPSRRALQDAATKKCHEDEYPFKLVVDKSPVRYETDISGHPGFNGRFVLSCHRRNFPLEGKACPFTITVVFVWEDGKASRWKIIKAVNKHHHLPFSADELGPYRRPVIRAGDPSLRRRNRSKKVLGGSKDDFQKDDSESEEDEDEDGDGSTDQHSRQREDFAVGASSSNHYHRPSSPSVCFPLFCPLFAPSS
jgi:hypothetical protein